MPQLIPPFSVNVLKFCCVRIEDIQAQIPLRDLRLYKEMALVVWDCDSTDDITSQNLKVENESLPVSDSTDDESDDSEVVPVRRHFPTQLCLNVSVLFEIPNISECCIKPRTNLIADGVYP